MGPVQFVLHQPIHTIWISTLTFTLALASIFMKMAQLAQPAEELAIHAVSRASEHAIAAFLSALKKPSPEKIHNKIFINR